MKTARPSSALPTPKRARIAKPEFQRVRVSAWQRLRTRLADAEETLRALRGGEVDSVRVAGTAGAQVFTLEGAEHAYRLLIESMNEGALTLTADAVVLYANQCFARMVKCPLEQVIGRSLRRFLCAKDRAALRPLLERADHTGAKIQVQLNADDDSQRPVQISIRPLAKNALNRATFGVVVTDMTEARRTEEQLRALTNRMIQVQEAERSRVALELHNHITQLLCAVLIRSQALAHALSAREGPVRREARQLRELVGQTALEVERISRELRPSVLEELGLVAGLRGTSTEFAQRTGVAVKLTCVALPGRLSAASELTLYRIFQEALRNVQQHARARHVTVRLSRQGAFVQLAIRDDGIGFDPDRHPANRNGGCRLGVLGMRERAAYGGGTFRVSSAPRAGTEIQVRLPLPSKTGAARQTDL